MKYGNKDRKRSLNSNNEESLVGVTSSFLHAPMCPYGTNAYVIRPRGAQKLLDKFPCACYHVDIAAWGFKELQILAIHPIVAWQTH